jgi:hypothetical protein
MILAPREHGAYGQLALPILTALGAAGVTVAALLLVACAVAAFVAHEPASVLLGLRGPRMRRELRTVARRRLAGSAGIAAASGAITVLSMEAGTSWSLAVPALPALVFGILTMRGREKSWPGEVAAAAAFAALAMPVSMAAGAAPRSALAITLPFAVLFVAGTLAVRTVVLRVRGGGDVQAASRMRRGAAGVAVAGMAGLAWLAARDVMPPAAPLAAAPGLTLALAIAARPPHPSRLRALGWTLVAACGFAAAVLVILA